MLSGLLQQMLSFGYVISNFSFLFVILVPLLIRDSSGQVMVPLS